MRRPSAGARPRLRGCVLIRFEDILSARERITDLVRPTPLIRLQAPESDAEIWLKLENLTPIGSFKLRGAGNAVRSAPRETLERGLWTTSAGNMAQGVAWACA